MDGQPRFIWVDFYQEFADKLLAYKNIRQALIAKVKQMFDITGINMPLLEADNQIEDIDPFTVFGLFNKGLTDANRTAILHAFANLFDIKAEVPLRFDGIPVLNPMKATFYGFMGDRGDKHIDNLWSLFEAALLLTQKDDEEVRSMFCSVFDQVISQKCVRWNITMGLYWIRPYYYLSLDSRNRDFLSNSDKFPFSGNVAVAKLRTVPKAKEYLAIQDACKNALLSDKQERRTLTELTHSAWEESDGGKSNAAFLHWFRPVIEALRQLGGSGTPAETLERIIANEQLTEEEISVTRGKSNVNKFKDEVHWARNYLAAAGYIDKTSKGVWTLTEEGKTVEMTDELASEIFKTIRAGYNTPVDTLGDKERETHYWLYAPGKGAGMWEKFYQEGIMALGWDEIGNLCDYGSKSEIAQKLSELRGTDSSHSNDALSLWQFCKEMQPGDIVLVKRGRKDIIGMGEVTSDYYYDDSFGDYPHYRKVNWTDKGHWKNDDAFAMKALTDVTKYTEFVERITTKIIEDRPEKPDEPPIDPVIIYRKPSYTADDFLEEVYMDEQDYETLVSLIRTKKNVILQGAPGVGKTYAAKRLAYSMMGEKDADRVMMVQFHQSYSYEDFIMGFRPSEKGFELKHGAFYTFCKKAEEDSDNEYFFIIDEVNRGNLSKIFGELFMLIESDKRGIELRLLYANEKFSVPANVYIIGIMNTADRSLAMLDYALRRRFAFFEMQPGFENDGFRAYRMALQSDRFNRLIQCVENLNNVIAADESLGEGFRIGHSYFCNLKEADEQTLSNIVEFELIPLLKEYWFDEPTKVKDWTNNLRSAIK